MSQCNQQGVSMCTKYCQRTSRKSILHKGNYNGGTIYGPGLMPFLESRHQVSLEWTIQCLSLASSLDARLEQTK